jgi:hypothetical protein
LARRAFPETKFIPVGTVADLESIQATLAELA